MPTTASEQASGRSQALARILSGAYVLTLKHPDGGFQAVLLSFVQQVGLEPPRIIAALGKERPIVETLERAGRFVLNVCAEDARGLLARLVEASQDPMRVLRDVGGHELDAGWVVDSAAAYLVCKVVERVDIGDHWLYIADVDDGTAPEGRAPLVHIRRSGLRY